MNAYERAGLPHNNRRVCGTCEHWRGQDVGMNPFDLHMCSEAQRIRQQLTKVFSHIPSALCAGRTSIDSYQDFCQSWKKAS